MCGMRTNKVLAFILIFMMLIGFMQVFTQTVNAAATVLNPGDIVIVSINGDVDDPNSYARGFSFMPLVNLTEGTVINFTDYGWSDSTNAFITNNGIADAFIHYTAPAGGITAGTVIRCDSYQNSNFTYDYSYSGTGNNYLNTAGLSQSDELLVFTGDRGSPTFIYAVTFVSTAISPTGWATNVGTNGTDGSGAGSALPPGLIDDQTALSFNQPSTANDNSSYSGATTAANKADWQDRVKTYTNWTFNDAIPIPTPPSGPFTVLGLNSSPTATNVQASGTLNVGQTLTGIYTYNDADSDAQGASTFKWYRSDNAAGLNKAQIGGQTTTSYTLSTDDLGKYISFEVTPVASAGITPGTPVESTRVGPVTKKAQAAVVYNDVTKTYGDAGFAHTATGGSGTGAFSYSSSDPTVATINAATGNVVILKEGNTTLTATRAGDAEYDAASDTCTLLVNKKIVTIITASANNKTYSASVAATGSITLGGVLEADAGQVTASGTFAFADAAAGDGKTVNVTGIALAGAKSGNYTLNGVTTASTTANISKKVLTASATANNKPYDGNTNATGSIVLATIEGADAGQVTASGTFAFEDANAANGKTVNVTGIALAGAKSGNYTLDGVTTASTTANITKADIAGITFNNSTVTYDGTAKTIFITGNLPTGASVAYVDNTGTNAGIYNATANITGGTNYNNISLNATLTINKANIAGITFSNATVPYDGSEKSVVISGTLPTGASVDYVTNTGTNAGTYNATANITGGANYNDTSLNATLTIQKVQLTATVGNYAKNYGEANPAFAVAVTGFVNGENAGTAAGYAAPTAASLATPTTDVGPAAITINGGAATNYSFDISDTGVLTINPKILTATATADNKTYNRSAAATGTIQLTGVEGADAGQVTASGTFAFEDADADVGKTVNVTGIALAGAKSGNYTLDGVTTAATTANITAKILTFTVSADDKVYDGNTTATGTVNLTGVEVGDTVTASGTFAFTDAAVGVGKTVNVTGITLGGVDAGNYTLGGLTTGSTAATITKQVQSIEVSTLPTKTTYAYGEALDVAGGIVTITYTDTTTETTALTDGMCQVATTPAIGIRVVDVTYLTKTDTFNVTYTKANQVAPAAPTLSVTASGITVTAPLGVQYEYSRDGGTSWQNGMNFTGLTHNTAYTITARLKETSTHNASAASAGTNATFLDITAPTLTAGAVARTSDTAGTVKFTSNEAGQYYYAIVADNATEPAIDTTGAGTNCTTAEATITDPTGLTAGAKDIYIKVKDAAGNVSNALKMDIAAYVAPSSGNSDPTPTPTPTPQPTEIIVNGEVQNAGTTTTTTVGDQTVTTVTVDDKKIEEKLEKEGNNATVVIPVNNDSDVVVGELNGQTVKSMENKEAVLEIKTENVTYTLPAAEINIDDVSAQIGQQVELKDIKVKVTIAEPSADTAKIVENTASRNSYQVVVKPVEFNITCTSGDKTVEVSKFNGYVERMVAIPDGIDPSKITTGIVLNTDGTFSHVPTTIVVIDGKYYAKINSLTNSVYSVIWNPMIFSDVAGYGATGDAINDMGSRLIISGIGNNNYAPERDITRAEFSVIIVKALGLRPVSGKSSFSDVAVNAGYAPYIQTAYEYSIISGYGNGKFGPDDKITREQAMTMIGNAMKITKLKVTFAPGEADKLLSAYTDSGSIISWGRQSMAACIKAGIISGRGNMTLAPKAFITRAEVAIIVRKLLVKSGLI